MYELNVDNRIFNNLRATMNSLIESEHGILGKDTFRDLFMSSFKNNPNSLLIYDLLLPLIQVLILSLILLA